MGDETAGAPPVPPVPEPDAKDWTWVLDSPCPECGFDASRILRDEIGGEIRQTAIDWRVALAGDIRRRPAPTTWSVLEYGAHCRDVYLVFGERLNLMMTQDDPQFANWDQDATALQKHYWDSDPTVVSAELGRAATVAADGFDAVSGQQWARTGRRSNGSVFTVETLGGYFLHDLVHHLSDIGRPMRANRPAI